MNKEHVDRIMKRFNYQLEKDDLYNLKRDLSNIPDKYENEILNTYIKNTFITCLLSIFLGIIGAELFYLGKIKNALIKIAIIVEPFVLACSKGSEGTIGKILLLIITLFFCFRGIKKTKEYNNCKLRSKVKSILTRENTLDKKSEGPQVDQISHDITNEKNMFNNPEIIKEEKQVQSDSSIGSEQAISNREAKQCLIEFLEKTSLKGTIADIDFGSMITIKINICDKSILLEIIVRPQYKVITSAFNFGKIKKNEKIVQFINDFNKKYEIAKKDQVLKLHLEQDMYCESETLKLIAENFFNDIQDLNDKICSTTKLITDISNSELVNICNLISKEN